MPRYIIFLILCLVIAGSATNETNNEDEVTTKTSNSNYDGNETESDDYSSQTTNYAQQHGKIVGGENTDIRFVPYQASFQANGKHLCGGSVIHSFFVLTAAHCVEFYPEGATITYTVRGGSNYLTEGGEVRTVVKIIVHPYWNSYTDSYDAALLELDQPFTFEGYIRVVPLAEKEPKPGDEILISGWGALKENHKSPETLQSVTVPAINRRKCRNIYTKIHPITYAMVCAGYIYGGKDACQGDSGGPAVCDGKLVGIVSWGKGCARKGMPGVYTNVALIRPWIEEQISLLKIK